ncbi:DNA polymerase III subunit epsilon [Shewanella sp. D64]|uniref:DNA polymerase III subunit epsilon n=1 Tax=unclassified Shewanella TaxID=196818 RepID=UPI0022BA41FF|nr:MULTISPECIES: DNA polymerase III subunit epsilon [unclassified Shewanella]MEC4725563.1 DNA polymerase III subunit epsilon [Shewanella sp. D64]MEC4739615.1 DNA polymerase III subunit epsilon [Shewanella sp. E94]WBJ94918.1 DNA polymerase III subunit epsilon [Shewanella sp. MTB7]
MSKLNAEERKARDNERFSQRVDERRVKGEDVVAYALANKKAYKFLTKPEKHELKQRQIALQNEVQLTEQEKQKLRDEQELDKVQTAFTEL